jgi:hypothetical protein
MNQNQIMDPFKMLLNIFVISGVYGLIFNLYKVILSNSPKTPVKILGYIKGVFNLEKYVISVMILLNTDAQVDQ